MPYQPDPSICCSADGDEHELGKGLQQLVAAIRSRVQGRANALVCLDFYWCPEWERVLSALRQAWPSSASWFVTTEALKSPSQLETELTPYLTEDPVFGRVCDRDMDLFFQPEAWAKFCQKVQQANQKGPVVVAGPAAMQAPLRNQAHCGVYLQVPRETIFVPSQAGIGRNIGDDRDRGPWPRYKRSFYVDWPVQDRHRDRVWEACDLVADISDPDSPAYLSSDLLRTAFQEVCAKPFRVRSLFMPGVWGGQRLRELVPGLPEEWPNCAWGFELVGPENSIQLKLGDRKVSLRVPFNHLMSAQARAVLGRDGFRRYGDFFPIRFDFLDTIGGSNLSCQVHPPEPYINSQFREPMAQHETYYIMEAEAGAKVFLGVASASDRASFQGDVIRAETEHQGFELEEHVNAWPAQAGDLFVIPAGTVHCSGEGNLVLEISATPYIYTFKIYDYLRPDLNGKPRPISSRRAFEVLDFERNTEWVEDRLLARPTLLQEGDGWHHFLLSDDPLMPHRIERVELEAGASWGQSTSDQVQVLCLVEGDKLKLDSATGSLRLAYGETVVVPAGCPQYSLTSSGKARVVKCNLRQ